MRNHADLELDLATIEHLSEEREGENIDFRAYLKGQDSEKIDRIVHRLNRTVSDQVDCTKCGNCCARLSPSIESDDIIRIAARLEMKAEEVKEKYVEKDEWDHYFKHLPCSFLKDKKCTIYEDRPDDCRSFPHLHKSGFTSRLFGVLQNYAICPIVFNVVERLKREVGYRYFHT